MIILSGLTSVGQDEVVILLEVEEGETLPPREVFTMLQVMRYSYHHLSYLINFRPFTSRLELVTQ